MSSAQEFLHIRGLSLSFVPKMFAVSFLFIPRFYCKGMSTENGSMTRPKQTHSRPIFHTSICIYLDASSTS